MTHRRSSRHRPVGSDRIGSVGILGGTFDPVHLGHLAIAEAVREPLDLERIVFVPAACRRTSPAGR